MRPRSVRLASRRPSPRRAPFKPEANRLLGGGDAPPEFVEIEFKRGSAASFQSLPIFSHTTRYLPVTSRGVGPLVFEAEGPDLSRRGGPEWFGVERRDAGEITLVEESPSSGSRRAVSPDTCLLALGRCKGFDVVRLCHFVRKLRPALAEQQVCDIAVPDPANSLWRNRDMLEPAGD
jgi:hypothetical protein